MPPRIQIRPPRREPPINVNDTWNNVLEPAINQIYRLQSSDTTSSTNLSFKVLYDSSYRLVTQGHGKTLCRKVSEITRSFLVSLPKFTEGNDSDLLTPLSDLWTKFQKSLEMVCDVFMYLDRSYCDENRVPRTDQMGKQLFRDEIVSQNLEPLFGQLIEQIDRERNGLMVDSQVLKIIVELLRGLADEDGENSSTLFDTKFRIKLLATTIETYKARLSKISDQPAFQQLKEIENWLIREARRGTSYLPEETISEVLEQLKLNVIEPALPSIFGNKESGVNQWVHTKQLEALELASKLEQLGTTRSLVDQVADCLTSAQISLNASQEDTTIWVEKTISLRSEYVTIANAIGQFSWEKTFDTLHKAAISQRKMAEEDLALYLDKFLKKSSTIPSEAIEPALANALVIYTALRDKDEFSRKFQRLLARRLLNSSSRSVEYEMSWLRRLREEDANSDGRMFEDMLKDISESQQLFTGSDSISPGMIQTSVNVLKMNLWPKSMQPNPQSSYPVVLPPVLADAQENFIHFYHQVKKDRKLNWNYALGNADVKIRAGGKTYFVSVPLICMSILGLFEGDNTYTTQEISQLTQIPLGGEVERHLKSLYLGTHTNLLVKTPEGKTVLPTDKFVFNESFSSPKPRFKIKVVFAKGQSAASLPPEDTEILAQDRAQRTSAAVVRTMKAHKEMKHAHLIEVVTNMLRPNFVAAPQLIKTAIQDLLDKEYLERLEHDNTTYKYVA